MGGSPSGKAMAQEWRQDMLAHRIGFAIILVVSTVAFIAVILPLYTAILWAVIFAILFFPVHARLERALGRHPNIAAALSVLMCICLVILPGLVLFNSLARQAADLITYLQSGEMDLAGLFRQAEAILPEEVREWLNARGLNGLASFRERLSALMLQGGGFFAGKAVSFGQNTLQFILAFGVMLYLLFFLFRDGDALTWRLHRSIPLSADHTRRFARRFTSVVRATVRGNIIIAVIQGGLGGLTFWALGLRPALLWGFTMSMLSLLPAVGAPLVWVPAVLYLALAGFWGKAVILMLIGVFVISLVDNLLRPPLVGQETRLPDYVVLISTVGGIALFGVNGIVIGPLIAALFMTAWSIFIDETMGEEGTKMGAKRGKPASLPPE